jgi:NADP-dependent 3-hydroxy acid dehydrogenase YdfG
MGVAGTTDRTALVTGATSGIGRAIGGALAGAGFRVHAIGRDRGRLASLRDEAGPDRIVVHTADLADDAALAAVADEVAGEGRLGVLVHAAGVHVHQRLEDASLADFDAVIRTNLRAPFELTRRLLPALVAAQGEVVFVNSSVGIRSGPGIAAYGASKHAMRALADSLRDEVNPSGVRVLSLYVGRTATPMQAGIHAGEGRPYEPDRLVQPGDVAALVLAAIGLPRTAEVTEISVRPMRPPRERG